MSCAVFSRDYGSRSTRHRVLAGQKYLHGCTSALSYPRRIRNQSLSSTMTMHPSMASQISGRRLEVAATDSAGRPSTNTWSSSEPSRCLLRLLQQDSYTAVSDCATIFSLRTATLPIVASIIQIPLFANTRSSTFSSSLFPISQVVVSHIHPHVSLFRRLDAVRASLLRIADRG